MSRLSAHIARPFVFLPASVLLLLAGGCAVPVTGPTAPVEFIKEGRQWTAAQPANAPMTSGPVIDPNAAAVPVSPESPASAIP